MTDLSPLAALGGATPRAARLGALTLTENAGLALASLALLKGAVPPAPFGLTLPGPGQWVASDGIAAFWTGPGQWMIEAPGRAAEDFAAALAAEAPGCAVTEQTDGWCAVEIASAAGEGPLAALLAKLVNVDTAALGPGCATRSGLEYMSVFVVRRAGDRVALIGMRSSAGSLWHAIHRAAERLEGAAA